MFFLRPYGVSIFYECVNFSHLQNITAAPGEILTFNISALDEGGNWKEAVWSYNDYTDVS